MIGYIITGHGSFAPGLSGSIEMIAGEQDNFEALPFLESDSLEAFEERVAKAAKHMEEKVGSVIIFTDMLGGTPFRAAMLAAEGREGVAVIAGTNLPMLIEGCLLRENFDDAKELAQMLVEAGKESISYAVLETKEEDTEEEEGI